jgi:hypothetical protein
MLQVQCNKLKTHCENILNWLLKFHETIFLKVLSMSIFVQQAGGAAGWRHLERGAGRLRQDRSLLIVVFILFLKGQFHAVSFSHRAGVSCCLILGWIFVC